jgi:hypothetical protein
MAMTRTISALTAAVTCVGVCAGPAAASTANTSKATQVCGKVSASSVSSIVGYSVPAGVGISLRAPATKENDYISGTTIDCTFGASKSLATIKKSVNLDIETVSKSVNASELKKLVDKQQSTTGLKVKIVPYPGLGSESFLMSFSEGGITAETLVTAESGTHLVGATVESKLSVSKLASLVKLAEKL